MKKLTVYDYLISCPSDIKDEMEIIKRIVEKHNSSIAYEYDYSIRIKHWSIDTYPELENHPQSIINSQLVDSCDGVIAIFWTRFGTPTTKYNSGTEEEIERLLNQHRPILLYFSDLSIKPSVLKENLEQYNRVQSFREKYKDKGIYFTYSSLDEFEIMFERHLQLHCKRYINKADNIILNSNNNLVSKKHEHLSSRLIDFMSRKDYLIIKSIFKDSISQEVSIYFKRLLSETPNYNRVNIQIFLETIYSMSIDDEMSREQCCFYMGCLNTKPTLKFLEEQLNKEKSYLVLRGVYFALINLTAEDNYTKKYLELIQHNPIAASINAGYHQIHYGDKYSCEGYKFDLYLNSINSITALISHFNCTEYKKIRALDIFTYKYILYYSYLNDFNNIEIPSMDKLVDNEIESYQLKELCDFFASMKNSNNKTYYVTPDLIKYLPSPDWMVKKIQEYKSLLYIDDDFQPISHNNCIETYKQQFLLDEKKFDKLVTILREYDEFRKDSLNVCDIGCSYGSFLHCWAKYYTGNTMGIDISEGASNISQLLFLRNYNIVEENVYDSLPPLSEEIDVFTCFDFLEHVFNLEYFLFMLFEAAKPNSLAVFYIPIFEENEMNLDELHSHKFFTDGHIYYFTQKGFKDFVSKVSGYELLHERPIGKKFLFIYKKK